MHYSLHHQTVYNYSGSVSYSQHLAHLCPLNTNRQRLISYNLDISPSPKDYNTDLDYFQNQTEYFALVNPHNKLEINAYSEVEVLPNQMPLNSSSPHWESVRDALANPLTPQDLSSSEFIYPSKHCPHFPEITQFALRAFTPGAEILDAALRLNSMIHEEFKFDPKATTVTTSVRDVFQQKAGVCQDFAHLQITALRSIGLAARYISGYIRTSPPPGKPRLIGADASHAWISLYVPNVGWVEYDSTNNIIPNLDHITVAYGRDYDDICPIRGVVYGGGTQTLNVGVTLTPKKEIPPHQ